MALRSHAAPRRLGWVAVAWLAWIVAQACLSPAFAQQNAAAESAVKAAFLFRFPSFVEWPASAFGGPADPLVIAVIGNPAVAASLEQLAAGRAVNGRAVVARRLQDTDSLANVHVLMVGATREARLRDLLRAAPGPVLVVTEQEGGLAWGSVLNFTTEDGRVRFSASLASAESRGLKLSARLLAVAQNVESRSP